MFVLLWLVKRERAQQEAKKIKREQENLEMEAFIAREELADHEKKLDDQHAAIDAQLALEKGSPQ